MRKIDLFLHDSLHTYEQMMFEYRVAWPYIRVKGVLLSDDVGCNEAFKKFSSMIKGKVRYCMGDSEEY